MIVLKHFCRASVCGSVFSPFRFAIAQTALACQFMQSGGLKCARVINKNYCTRTSAIKNFTTKFNQQKQTGINDNDDGCLTAAHLPKPMALNHFPSIS